MNPAREYTLRFGAVRGMVRSKVLIAGALWWYNSQVGIEATHLRKGEAG